jgi:hypothetical protein
VFQDLYLIGITGLVIVAAGILVGVLIYAVGRHFTWWQPVGPCLAKLWTWVRSWAWAVLLPVVFWSTAWSILALGLALVAEAVAVYQAGRVRSGSEAYGVLVVYVAALLLLIIGVLLTGVGLIYSGPQ